MSWARHLHVSVSLRGCCGEGCDHRELCNNIAHAARARSRREESTSLEARDRNGSLLEYLILLPYSVGGGCSRFLALFSVVRPPCVAVWPVACVLFLSHGGSVIVALRLSVQVLRTEQLTWLSPPAKPSQLAERKKGIGNVEWHACKCPSCV